MDSRPTIVVIGFYLLALATRSTSDILSPRLYTRCKLIIIGEKSPPEFSSHRTGALAGGKSLERVNLEDFLGAFGGEHKEAMTQEE